jgi:hypothetical protein
MITDGLHADGVKLENEGHTFRKEVNKITFMLFL